MLQWSPHLEPDMPPKTESPVVPTSMGTDARTWLEHHGIVPAVPTIRSSDWEMSANPFHYYLTRRLGLIPALSWSKALNRGGYFHIPFALYNHPDKWVPYQGALVQRCDELRAMCKELGITEDNVMTIIDREKRDASVARAWYEATETVVMSRKDDSAKVTFQQYMAKPHWKKIGSEIRIVYADSDFPETPLVIQIDVLLLNTKTNRLWIVDAKTCSSTPIVRLTTVRNEFQTQHYMITLDKCLIDGLIQKKMSLPEGTQLGGMIHVAVQKPTIIFGMKDRAYRWTSYGKGACTEGTIMVSPDPEYPFYAQWKPIPNDKGKGLTGVLHGSFTLCTETLHAVTGKKPSREFHGEPDLALFIQRCRDWYKTQQDSNEDDPPVNMCITDAGVLRNKMWMQTYNSRLLHLYRLATTGPVPANFPMYMRGAESFGKLTPYAMFYVTTPEHWPEIVREQHFITRRRDEDIEGTTETVLETPL